MRSQTPRNNLTIEGTFVVHCHITGPRTSIPLGMFPRQAGASQHRSYQAWGPTEIDRCPSGTPELTIDIKFKGPFSLVGGRTVLKFQNKLAAAQFEAYSAPIE